MATTIYTVNALVDAVAAGVAPSDALAAASKGMGTAALGFEPSRDFWTPERRAAYEQICQTVRAAGGQTSNERARETYRYDPRLARRQTSQPDPLDEGD